MSVKQSILIHKTILTAISLHSFKLLILFYIFTFYKTTQFSFFRGSPVDKFKLKPFEKFNNSCNLEYILEV